MIFEFDSKVVCDKRLSIVEQIRYFGRVGTHI